jgi:hypothetical protein
MTDALTPMKTLMLTDTYFELHAGHEHTPGETPAL